MNANRGSDGGTEKQMGYTKHVTGSENKSALDGEAPDW
jgi:hypothetical protein